MTFSAYRRNTASITRLSSLSIAPNSRACIYTSVNRISIFFLISSENNLPPQLFQPSNQIITPPRDTTVIHLAALPYRPISLVAGAASLAVSRYKSPGGEKERKQFEESHHHSKHFPTALHLRDLAYVASQTQRYASFQYHCTNPLDLTAFIRPLSTRYTRSSQAGGKA